MGDQLDLRDAAATAACVEVAHDPEVVFRLPQGVDAADFEDDLEISFNPKKRVHKRVLADVSNSSSPARSGQRKPATRHFFWDKGQAPMWSSSAAVVLDAGERDALCVGFAKAEARSPKRSKTAASAATATGQSAAETGARKASAAESSTSVLSMERRRQIGIVFARLKIDAGKLGHVRGGRGHQRAQRRRLRAPLVLRGLRWPRRRALLAVPAADAA